MNHIHKLMNVPVSLALALGIALLATPANAALTGELQGYVIDESGLPISGVRAILSSPQMIGGEKVIVTDADGRFRFAELDPGAYTVLLSHQSYRGFKEESIAVGVGSKVVRDYLLEPAATVGDEAEVIRVVATAPMVDPTRTTSGMSIRPDLTDRTVTSRSYQDVALLTPGVVDADGDGNPAIHGGTSRSNIYLLDGLNITDPVTQTFSTNFNFDSIGELQIMTGGLDAEYGSTTGGVVNIVTKSGGDEFTLDSSVYWKPSELYLTDPGESINQNVVDANVAVGGPIIHKKLWFFLSGQYIDSQAQTLLPPGQEQIFPGVDEIPLRRFNAFYGLGKLKWALLPWQKLTLLMQGDPTTITNEQQDPTVHPDAERQRYQGGVKMIGTSETTISENLFWKTMVGYGTTRLHLFPMSDDLLTPGHGNSDTGTSTVNDSIIIDDNRYRVQLQTHLTYFLEDFMGDHEIKGGIESGLAWNVTDDNVTGNPGDCVAGGIGYAGCTFNDNGTPDSFRAGATIDGVGNPNEITVYDGALQKTVTSNLVSLFLQDTWRPFRSLTIRPGVRFDSSRGYNDQEDGGEEIFNLNALSPRLGVAWDPFGDGKTVVRGGYYVYQETGLLLVPSFVGRAQVSKTYKFSDITNAYTEFVSESGGPGAVEFKEGMKNPIMHEVLFGFGRELWEDAALSVDVTFRRRQNMFEDDESNIIWNERGSDAIGFQNGEPREIYSVGTPDNAMGQYIGLDVMFEKRFADSWTTLLTYTLQRLEGTVEEGVEVAFDEPRQAPFEYGFLGDDVRHRASGTLSYDLPYGFMLGGTATYLSGSPTSKFFANSFYGGAFIDRCAPRGYDPVDATDTDCGDPSNDIELRLPDTFNVDIRLAWRLKELTTQDIWLIADIENVFNSRPTTSFENRNLAPGGATSFGDPLSRGDPTNVSLAVRYMY